MTKLQEKILDCTAKGMSIKETMSACDCSESIVKQIRTNKELQEAYEGMRNEDICDSLLNELKMLALDPKTDSSVKLSALKYLLEINNEKSKKQDINVTVTYV